MPAMIRTQIGNPKFPSASLEAVIDVSGPFTLAASFGNSENCTLWTQAGDFVLRVSLSRALDAIERARECKGRIKVLPEEKPSEAKTSSEPIPKQTQIQE